LQAAAGSFLPPPSGAGNAGSSGPVAAQDTIEFLTDPNPAQKGTNAFRVKLAGPGNSPAAGANVSVTFYMAAMPAMGMAAMKTTTKLNDKGNGLYEGTGSIGSGGTWQVTIVAQENGTAIATKQLSVSVTGGM
jgi:hypothetical protein